MQWSYKILGPGCGLVWLAAQILYAQSPSFELSSSHPKEDPSGQVNHAEPVEQLIARKCINCHGGEKPSGDVDLSRPSVIARDDNGRVELATSRLWEVVRDDLMPPEHPLSADEKAVLREWIERGAPNEFEPINPFRFTTDHRAGFDWWALQPIIEPTVPSIVDKTRIRTSIDRFLFPELLEHGLSFSPDAEPRHQIRRLYFDLIGLPPPPEVIEKFAKQPTDAAYSAIVDELLDMPEYGERWARHWLDIVRYGESDGFERNGPRRESWRYRDWVIDAINQDLPFNEFARRQIAGDVLCEDPVEGVVATGFLVAGVHNTVVGASKSMQLLARQDELEDLVGAIGQTFIGLTFNCARCHDHKFDPVTQLEYYRLVAALADVNHGVRTVRSRMDTVLIEELTQKIVYLEREIAGLEEPARQQILNRRRAGSMPLSPGPQPIASWSFDTGLENTPEMLGVKVVGDAHLTSAGLQLDGEGDFAITEPLAFELKEKTLEAWVQLDDLDQRGGAVISVETDDGVAFDAIVFGEQEPRRWMAGSDGFSRTESFGGSLETTGDEVVHMAITYASDGRITAFRNGEPYGTSYVSSKLRAYPTSSARILFGLRHSPGGGNRYFKGAIRRAKLHDRALSPAEVAASAGVENNYVSPVELTSELSSESAAQRWKWVAEKEQFFVERSKLETDSLIASYTAVSNPPGETFFLPRGDVLSPGAVVLPGTTAAIASLSASFELDATADAAQRRVQLARWLTDDQNPLFRRVLVNRLWHYHFGRGLIATPSDFGFNGGLPSHPALLDWLATELKHDGYRIKPLHRLIVNSTAYRQSSLLDDRAQSQDAESRWLWRKTPTRLDAEVVRDSILMISGKLNSARGGPGYEDVAIIDQNNGTTYYQSFDRDDFLLDRRTLYRFTPRGGRSALLDGLDCPDPSTATPRRSVTTTPLQALSLLNNDFMIRMSESFADRAKSNFAQELDGQIGWMFQMAVGRLPTEEELVAARELALAHGTSAVGRALFNCNEFMIVQ